jgi:dihydroorotate dehydrogenase
MSLADLAVPAIRLLAPEPAHRLTVRALAMGLGPREIPNRHPALRTTRFGLDFPNPIGLAAGFDKDAEAIGGAFGLGFGFVEVGTITPRPQAGNPKPRLFRLAADRAVINRMGFNNGGMAAVAGRLVPVRAEGAPGPVGINIGKNKDSADAVADYAACAARLAPMADYMVINVSSPNTPGLRALQSAKDLTALIDAVRSAAAEFRETPPPVLVKIAPDLGEDDLRAVVDVARDRALAGLIVSNTTIARPDTLRDPRRSETGGLSGAPLFAPSTAVLRRVYALSDGAVPLIGVGGIASAEDAYAKIRAGACLVQLYSALVFQGPGLPRRIADGLDALLRRDGFPSVDAAVGADHGE